MCNIRPCITWHMRLADDDNDSVEDGADDAGRMLRMVQRPLLLVDQQLQPRASALRVSSSGHGLMSHLKRPITGYAAHSAVHGISIGISSSSSSSSFRCQLLTATSCLSAGYAEDNAKSNEGKAEVSKVRALAVVEGLNARFDTKALDLCRLLSVLEHSCVGLKEYSVMDSSSQLLCCTLGMVPTSSLTRVMSMWARLGCSCVAVRRTCVAMLGIMVLHSVRVVVLMAPNFHS